MPKDKSKGCLPMGIVPKLYFLSYQHIRLLKTLMSSAVFCWTLRICLCSPFSRFFGHFTTAYQAAPNCSFFFFFFSNETIYCQSLVVPVAASPLRGLARPPSVNRGLLRLKPQGLAGDNSWREGQSKGGSSQYLGPNFRVPWGWSRPMMSSFTWRSGRNE